MQDQTGPMGTGPKTGRGMGTCRGGFSWGRRFGTGLGFRRFLKTRDGDRKELLEEEADALKEDLRAVEQEIASLEK